MFKPTPARKVNPPFDPNDPGCGPALIDVATGRPLPEDHPDVVLATKIYMAAPVEQKRAFYRMTALFSEESEDLRLGSIILKDVSIALESRKVQA